MPSAAAQSFRSIRPRGRLAATALLCLFAQLSLLAHLSLAKHGVCLDHGELTEVLETSSAPQPATELTRAQPRDGAGVEVPPGATLSSVDEHCSLAQLVRQIDRGQPVALIQIPGEALPVARVARTSTSPRADVLDVAPKQSPPTRV